LKYAYIIDFTIILYIHIVRLKTDGKQSVSF